MKMSETTFKCISIAYFYYDELEQKLKETIKEYEKKGLIFQSISVMQKSENPREEYGHVCDFLVVFKNSKSSKKALPGR